MVHEHMKERPLSPFMIGPYYRPQWTSVLSIVHRLTGVALSVLGLPLLLAWIVSLDRGAVAYAAFLGFLSGGAGLALAALCLFSLNYHLCNGMRHLVWDTGRMLDLPAARRSGWLVVFASLVLTAAVMGAFL